MKKLLLMLAFVLSFVVPTYGMAAGGDPVPWPFASRCPFPWERIDGMWRVISNNVRDIFEFKIVSTTQSGLWIIEVSRYNEEMHLIATGRGLSPVDQAVIRLAMYRVNSGSEPNSYTVFVGNYGGVDKFSCERGTAQTVVTVRSYILDKNKDSHYIIEKVKRNKSL